MYISLKLKLFEIKAYLCKKFKEDPQYIKLSLNEYGSLRKLKDLNAKFQRKDLISSEIHLLQASRPQNHATTVFEDNFILTNPNEKDSTGYQNEEQEELYDAEYKYEGVQSHNSNFFDYVDHDEILKIKENALNSFQGHKEIIKIKSLKTLQKTIEEVLKNLPF